MDFLKFIAYFLIIFGAIILLGTFYVLYRLIKSLTYIDIDAVITSYEKSYGNKGGIVYKYRAEYEVGENKYYVLSTYSNSDVNCLPPIGSSVKVRFNPKNPKDAIITPGLQFLQSLLTFAIGIILIYIGYAILLQKIPVF